jgi:adenylyltransferase and sulfurtransferase
MVDAHELEDQLQQLQLENARLRAYIHSLAPPINGSIPHSTEGAPTNGSSYADARRLWDAAEHGLTREQVGRYSRQIILPSFGVHAQSRLCNGSVLVIGAGGLGSPALLYLAAAGVGRIGIVDRDAVELSNIHRQVIHKEVSVGCHKADSAASAVASLNSAVTVETFKDGFTPANALEIIRGYDVVIDASDNAPTRYLISDACAVVRKPLVSGAAIGTDGQLTVYCHGLEGPCYRCLFPQAPAPQSCARCVDAGVLGVVPGIIGTMQALEAIKLLAGIGEPLSRRLLIMDAMSGRFHTVKLRVRSPKCVACGDAPQITEHTLAAYDYGAFTGQAANDAAPRPLQLLEASQRIRPQELQSR